MDWQREMCGEVCRMDDRIAVVDDAGGWDVFDLGMNRLGGGQEADIEAAKGKCESWQKSAQTSNYDWVDITDNGGPEEIAKATMRDKLPIFVECAEAGNGFVCLYEYSDGFWGWMFEDDSYGGDTVPKVSSGGFSSRESALADFEFVREHTQEELHFPNYGPHWGKKKADMRRAYTGYHGFDPAPNDDRFAEDLAEFVGWDGNMSGMFQKFLPNGTCYICEKVNDDSDIDCCWVWFDDHDCEQGADPLVKGGFDDAFGAIEDFERYWDGRYIVTLDEMNSWQGPEWRPASRRGVEVPHEPARGSQASIKKQSSLASPSGNIYVNTDDGSAPYKRAIRDAVNVSPILDVYAMVYGPSWAYATAYRTYDYADPAVSNAYDKPTAWGWCIFDNWGPASKPAIISVSDPVFKTFESAASELERALDESPVGEHTSQNFANSPRVPEEVDSKDDEPCPLCGSDHFDGQHCQTCGYDVAPDGLDDIDIDDLDEVEDANQTTDNEGLDSSDETVAKDDGEDGASMSKASGWWDDDPRKVMYEDDLVVLHGPDGSVWYKGLYDYSPMHDDEDYDSEFVFNSDNGRYEHSDGSWYEKVGERRCAEAADSTIVRCVVPGDDVSDYARMIVVRGTTDEGDAMATASDVIKENTGMPPLSMSIERNVNFDEWQRNFPQSNYEVACVR